jgi:hypothetical protein
MEVEVKQINLQEEHLCDSASQSACPGTYGNPEHKGRPGGVPIEKLGGKTGGELWFPVPPEVAILRGTILINQCMLVDFWVVCYIPIVSECVKIYQKIG